MEPRLPTVRSGIPYTVPSESNLAPKEACQPLAVLEASLVYGWGTQISEVSTPSGLSEFSIPEHGGHHGEHADPNGDFSQMALSPRKLSEQDGDGEDLSPSDDGTLKGSSSSSDAWSSGSLECPPPPAPADARRSHALLAARRWSIEQELCSRFGAESCRSFTAEDDLHAHTKSRSHLHNSEDDSPAAGSSKDAGSWFNPFAWFAATAAAHSGEQEVVVMESEVQAATTSSKAKCELHPTAAALLERLQVKEHCGIVSGTAVLSGSLKEFPEAISNSLREALVSSVEPRASGEMVVCVWRGVDCAASAGWTVVASEHFRIPDVSETLSLAGPSFARFEFQIVTIAPGDAVAVARHLLMEAACGGARELLPALVDALGSDVGRLALRLEVSPVNSCSQGSTPPIFSVACRSD